MPMTEAKQTGALWLENGGVRPTRQRVTLAKLLVGDGQHRHVTAESLFDAARASGERVSLATVYNTLRAFSDAGLLREITVNGSKSYFDTNTTNHAHFYCGDNDTLADADTGEVRVSNLPEPPAGTEIDRVDVVIRLRKV
ncbi:Fur family transcriptional regulator, iron response regulator [Maritimibacter sp. HL-12]|jgi:Fur family transcriptional regulator, iron response regulator|nr:Fur family transcriptional regulator, iron response regulator [Maritimibacter sp. HL-12]